MLLDRDTATVAVVETASGAIVKVQTESLHAQDAVAELQRMIADLEGLEQPPHGLFVLGSGVDVSAVKSQLSLGTTLPVHAPEDAELALARGAALASAAAPRYEASTVGLGYAQDPDGTTAGKAYPAGADTEMSEAGTQMAAAGYMAPLGYSEVLDELEGDLGYDAIPADPDFAVDGPERKPFLLVGSSLASIFVIGVVALVISLAVSIRPTVNQRPNPAESVIVPSSQTPAAVAPEAAQPPPSPPSVPDTIQEPVPVVQQAPRTVYVTPAPQAPAPAPAAPAPAPEAPAPVPEAPAPAPAPIAPVIPVPIIAPPVIVLPPLLPPFLRPPRAPHYPSYPSSPSYPSYPSSPPSQEPSYPSSPSQPSSPLAPSQEPSYPSAPSQPSYPSYPSSPVVTQAPSSPSAAAGSGSGSGGSSSSSGSEGGSHSSDSGGSGSSGRGSQSPLWPFPSFGH
jgi:uncharacterized membrane protein YgcG